MVFGNGVKNIQAAAYNGARTVCSRVLFSVTKVLKYTLQQRIYKTTFTQVPVSKK